MTRTYNSFVIRCWRSGDQVLQVVVEHVQSGEQERVTTIEAAFDRLCLWAELGPASRVAGPAASASADSRDVRESITESNDEQNLSL